MNKTYKFLQGNGDVVDVTIDPNSKKRFGNTIGNMWIVVFVGHLYECRQVQHYMDAENILKATGIDTTRRSWHCSKEMELRNRVMYYVVSNHFEFVLSNLDIIASFKGTHRPSDVSYALLKLHDAGIISYDANGRIHA
jgi:hypothetical protein